MSEVIKSTEQEIGNGENEMDFVYGIKPWKLDTIMLVYKYKGRLVILPEESLSLSEILEDWHDEWKESKTVIDRFSIRSSNENGGFDMDERDLDSEDFLYIKGFIDALYKVDNLCEIGRETIIETGHNYERNR